MAWAIDKKAGSVYAKAVLMHLANCTNKDTGMCRPRIKVIADQCEISETAVKTSLRALEEVGLVEKIPRFSDDGVQLSNDYRLLMSPVRSEEIRGGTGGGSGDDPRGRGNRGGGSGDDPCGSGDAPGVGRVAPPVETGRLEPGKEPKQQTSKIDVIEIWNKAVAGTNLPKAKHTPQRASIIQTRMKTATWIEDFETACKAIATSKWHQGDNDRHWVATIDLLLQADKATQVAERARVTPVAKSDKWNGIGDKDYNEGTEGLKPVEGAGDVAKYF